MTGKNSQPQMSHLDNFPYTLSITPALKVNEENLGCDPHCYRLRDTLGGWLLDVCNVERIHLNIQFPLQYKVLLASYSTLPHIYLQF